MNGHDGSFHRGILGGLRILSRRLARVAYTVCLPCLTPNERM